MNIIVGITAFTIVAFLALDAFGMLPEVVEPEVVEAEVTEPEVVEAEETKPTTSTLEKATKSKPTTS